MSVFMELLVLVEETGIKTVVIHYVTHCLTLRTVIRVGRDTAC